MIHFLKLHGYTLFVTMLVLALGAGSLHLRSVRTQPAAVSAAPDITAAPVVSAAPAPTLQARTWLRPVDGGMLVAYAEDLQYNSDMDCWQTHAAIDFAAGENTPVRAAADGRVSAVIRDPLLGLTIVIDHDDGYQTRFASLASAACTAGQSVRAGDAIGLAGSTADSEALLGAHLHFELTQNGLPLRPLFR